MAAALFVTEGRFTARERQVPALGRHRRRERACGRLPGVRSGSRGAAAAQGGPGEPRHPSQAPHSQSSTPLPRQASCESCGFYPPADPRRQHTHSLSLLHLSNDSLPPPPALALKQQTTDLPEVVYIFTTRDIPCVTHIHTTHAHARTHNTRILTNGKARYEGLMLCCDMNNCCIV